MSEVLKGAKIITRLMCGEAASMMVSYSSTMEDAVKERHVIYQEGKFVRPHAGCGPLAVFKDAEAALKFAPHLQTARTTYRELWEVEYRPYRGARKCQWVKTANVHKHDIRLFIHDLPEGTCLASHVRLIRRII